MRILIKSLAYSHIVLHGFTPKWCFTNSPWFHADCARGASNPFHSNLSVPTAEQRGEELGPRNQSWHQNLALPHWNSVSCGRLSNLLNVDFLNCKIRQQNAPVNCVGPRVRPYISTQKSITHQLATCLASVSISYLLNRRNKNTYGSTKQMKTRWDSTYRVPSTNTGKYYYCC